MRLRTLSAAVCAGALVVLGSSSATALSSTVDIRVALDLPSFDEQGPLTFAVDDVTPGDGPELTAADETANPSGYCGDARVDIDPVARTITVSADERPCNFETMTVDIGTAEIASITLVSDDLGTDSNGAVQPATVLATSVDATGVHLAWSPAPGVETWDVDGFAVFSYTEVVVAPPVVDPPVVAPPVLAPPVLAPPVVAPPVVAPAAIPVVARPTFAG